MKRTALLLSLLLSGFAGVLSCAEQFQFTPGFGDDNDDAVDPRTPVPLSPLPVAVTDFEARIRVAVEQRSLVGVKELYETNAVTSDDLKRELALWQPLFDQPAGARVSVFFKEFSAMPPAAHQFWTEYARRLTTHKVTHLVHLQNGTWSLVLPLIEVDGRLWIVPSDKRQKSPSTNQDSTKGGNRSQFPGTNGMQ